MKKNYMLLFLISVVFSTVSCSSSKKSKGGGWYQNRNLGYQELNTIQPTFDQSTDFEEFLAHCDK